MLKKIFACALTLAVMICFTGCGSEKVDGTPEKAVLAYAEISMTGESPNMAAAGFSDNDKKEIYFNVARAFVDSMKSIAPLSDESAQEITKKYFDKLKGEISFQSKLVKEDSEHPIVQITTTPIDQSETAKIVAEENDELIALVGMVGKLKAEGADDDKLKENPDLQKLAVATLEKYVNNIHFHPEKSFEVTCTKVKSSDGKIHWAPLDSGQFIDFLTGKS